MELVLGIVICGALLLFSAQSFYRAMNPNLKTIVAEYMSHDRSRYSIAPFACSVKTFAKANCPHRTPFYLRFLPAPTAVK